MIKAKELAQKLGVCSQTVRSLTKAGIIPGVRLGKIYRYDYEKVMESLKKQKTEGSKIYEIGNE